MLKKEEPQIKPSNVKSNISPDLASLISSIDCIMN